MAIKAGELLHVGNKVLVDRAQTAGPGNLTVPTERIYELGNYQTVAVIRDIPDLTFDMESLDVSAEMEAMLLGVDFEASPDGAKLDLAKVKPLDVSSLFKMGRTSTNPFDVAASVAIPFLSVESISYRFGLRDNASQSVSLRGDAIFYAQGSAYQQKAVGTNAADQGVLLANPALPYLGDKVNGTKYALGVMLASGKRLSYGTDYHETVTGSGDARTVTVVVHEPVPTTDLICIIYQSPTVAVYPQATHAVASATRPAAIKGRDIEIRVGGVAITDRWSSVQSVTVEQRLTVEKDEEFGNYQAVASDFDVPEVSGSVEIRPRDVQELLKRVRQIAGITNTAEVIGPNQAVPLPLEVRLHSPENGATLKTLYVPDARFTMPGFSGQVQQKLGVTLNFESDSGVLHAFKGERPAGIAPEPVYMTP